ncbi:uncharacterized protein ARMOST_18304 [Armillaria ostoyae]|uniref:Uncharacterized protein n=1 Tax=Armillaria ostoyae TaxID=47428 RepID=A0A284S1F3_ARMOS|nr:uncharacterized protein ARMOST_18304 [Armillaria ostoyae]
MPTAATSNIQALSLSSSRSLGIVHWSGDDGGKRPSCPASHVPAAVNEDLAWSIFNSSSDQWRLDIHIEGDWETLLLARPLQTAVSVSTLQITPSTRSWCTQAITGIDEEPPSQRHVNYRKVSSNRGLVGAHNFLFVQPNDIPLLPFHCQLLLHVAPHYRYEEPNAPMGQIEAYLTEDPKREPTTTARPNDYDGTVLYGDLVRNSDALLRLISYPACSRMDHSHSLPLISTSYAISSSASPGMPRLSAGEECSVVPLFKVIRVLDMRKTGTSQVKTLQGRARRQVSTPEAQSRSSLRPLDGRPRAANVSPALEHVVPPSGTVHLTLSPTPILVMSCIRRSVREEFVCSL